MWSTSRLLHFCQTRKKSYKQFYQSLNDLPNNGMIKQITLSTLFLYLMESFMLVHNVIQEVRKAHPPGRHIISQTS